MILAREACTHNVVKLPIVVVLVVVVAMLIIVPRTTNTIVVSTVVGRIVLFPGRASPLLGMVARSSIERTSMVYGVGLVFVKSSTALAEAVSVSVSVSPRSPASG